MKRSITPVIILLMTCVAFAQGADNNSLKDKSGKFGLALQPTLAFGSSTSYGTNDVKTNWNDLGLTLLGRYGFTRSVQGELGFGFASSGSSRDDYSRTTSGLNVHAGLNLLPFDCESPLDLGILFGVDVFNGTYKLESGGINHSDDVSSLMFNAGFRVEYHAQNWFNINLPVSVYLNINPIQYTAAKYDGDKDSDDLGIAIFGTQTFGQAGFTFWFK